MRVGSTGQTGWAFLPKGGSQAPAALGLTVLPTVTDNEKYHSAVPVYDLAVAAGGFTDAQSPTPTGWAKLHTGQQLDKHTFVARVVGHSMESGIPNGSWGLFRMWTAGATPSPTAPDGKRVVVQLRDETDLDTGGQYTLKRWKVTKLGPDMEVLETQLRPDNPAFKSRRFSAKDADLRAVAEFLEVVG